ncbi:alpha/beta hydrolase [Shewanella sp. A25]|nr:alpha/beta hydrolase [Shewanella shenzhenensis]
MWQSFAPKNQVELVLPHIKLSGRIWGPKDKPLLLALHGWLDNANSFEPLAEHLTEYQLLAIDWPGHGFSQHRPGNYPLHWVDYLYDLDALLAILPQQPVAIIGHSLGGIIASAYTATFPEKVNRLILIEALSPLFEAPEQAKSRLRKSFYQHGKQLTAQRPNKGYETIETAVRARAHLTGMSENWCRLLLERNLQTSEQGICWRSDPRLKLDSPMRLTFAQVDALMQDVSVETLLICGKQGFSQLRTALPKARNWFHHLVEHIIEGDHHVHMDNAEGVAQLIRKFVEQLH